MWKDRDDIGDASEYVKKIRKTIELEEGKFVRNKA